MSVQIGPENNEPSGYDDRQFEEINFGDDATWINTSTPPNGIPFNQHQRQDIVTLTNEQFQNLVRWNGRRMALIGAAGGAVAAVLCMAAVGGIVVLNLADGSEKTGIKLPVIPGQSLDASATASATATLPATPTQSFPTEWATQFATLTQTPTGTPEPPTATADMRASFERNGLTLEDYLEHALVFAARIRKLPLTQENALLGILALLPDFVKKDNMTGPDAVKEYVTYVYRVGPNTEIRLREDEAASKFNTQMRIVRFDIRTGKFVIIRKPFQPELVDSSKFEFIFTPNDLKNDPKENPIDGNFLYVALQQLDEDVANLQFSEKDFSEEIDAGKLAELALNSIGMEVFRLTGGEGKTVSSPTPEKPTEVPRQPGGGGEVVNPTSQPESPTPQPPGPTPQPPGPTPQPPGETPVAEAQAASEKVAENIQFFLDQEGGKIFIIREDRIPLGSEDLFERFEHMAGHVYVPEKYFKKLSTLVI